MRVVFLPLQNMKIIKIKGGLGNQLFQYAYGRSLIEKNKEVIFDISFFKEKTTDISRPFLLKKFNIPESLIFINKKSNLLIKLFEKIYSKLSGNYNLFQSEKYFKSIEKIIRNELTLKESLSPIAQEFVQQIKNNSKSVSIHVRRGDYITNAKTNKYHGTCDLSYYEHTILKIRELVLSPHFFIFSDDIEWVRENLKLDNTTFISNPNLTECEELMLMSNCKHNIIANSTFSWWGAWLNQNPDKIVIAPKQWTANKKSDELNILPKTWTQI